VGARGKLKMEGRGEWIEGKGNKEGNRIEVKESSREKYGK